MNNKPELLAPAGNLEKLKVAFHFGADAVYVGLDKLSLRANADNFTRDEMREAVNYTHSLNKKIYIALNIYFTPDQTSTIIDALIFIEDIKPDGIIVSDPGTIFLAKKHSPNIPIHISTQANCTNQYAAQFYQSIGASRIVTARELSIDDIKAIRNETSLEIESFIHGSMCIAYSGRCLLSSYMTTNSLGSRDSDKAEYVRSANKGDCAHSCRWEFSVKEKSRQNQVFDSEEDENGTYIFSSKDICMIDNLKEVIDAGVNSFKIEGRMKSILYISSIIRSYRETIDRIFSNEYPYATNQVKNELDVVSHREFSTGYFFSSPKTNSNVTTSISYERNVRLAALVLNVENHIEVKVYNKITTDDKMELIGKSMKTIPISKIVIYNSFNEIVTFTNHTDITYLEIFDSSGNKIIPEIYDIIRIESKF